MSLDQDKIKEILIKENYIKEDEAQKAVEFVKTKDGDFLDYFIRTGRLTPDLIGQAFAEHFKVPYFDLNTNIPDRNLVVKIPEGTAKKFRVVLCKESDSKIVVATDNPTTVGLADEIKKMFPGKKIEIEINFSLPEDINSILMDSYKKNLQERLDFIIGKGQKVAPEIAEEIINDALDSKASDVHLDPQKEELVIRFRIDGLLHEEAKIPMSYYENILNRIKLQSGISTVEHFSAQDGAMRYERGNKAIDMRTSIVPTVEGEKIVIRILAESKEGFSLGDLGLSAEHQKIIMRVAKKPFGMILVTGPTGSGKTTTLYSLLKYLNSPEKNIATIEDPVEYKIPGVNHIQVNSATNLTFAEGLKSIVRQDPDIILVGEVRDKETASISVNAALAGHLLFSTFHANDAASVIPRFLEMGVEPFYLSLTLKLIIAQRLARKICDKCRYSYKISIKELSETFPEARNFFDKDEITLYKGKGCPNCSSSGYRGRTGLFEVIEIGSQMQEIMLKNPSAQQIWNAEKQQGIKPMFSDGLEKVKNGTITIEELLRVAEMPEQNK
jgi:type II secretory ATPase GspE/PulE/Tfp pilus assembly ATPase PilB-like protein